jgi:hypothetical protein
VITLLNSPKNLSAEDDINKGEEDDEDLSVEVLFGKS